MNKLLHMLNTPLITLVSIGAFYLLAVYSQSHVKDVPAEYDKQTRAAMTQFVIKKGKAYRKEGSPHKIAVAVALSDIWGISAEEAAKPVDLFGEGRKL